jgi:CubicO group peptidase (beta-lactamase class C family)
MGYGYQFWIFPGEQRRFALLGVYGQSIMVDPGLKLVIVQTAANATGEAGKTTLGREREALARCCRLLRQVVGDGDRPRREVAHASRVW